MIHLSVKGGSVAKSGTTVKLSSMTAGLLETFRHLGTVVRGSLLGTTVGAIPGVGGTVVAFLSYSVTVQMSKNPDSFGKGNIKGVIAPESAICAHDCSALIPTLTFGIPAGHGDAAVQARLTDYVQPDAAWPTDAARSCTGDLWTDLAH